MVKPVVQQGRSERGAEAYSLQYVEGPRDARTPLAICFTILGRAGHQCAERRDHATHGVPSACPVGDSGSTRQVFSREPSQFLRTDLNYFIADS
jgi:hypothetical protein